MKPLKLITSLAAVACALAVSSARAQVTNLVTLNVLTVTQGATNDSNGTTTFTATKAPHSTPQLLQELGPLLNPSGLSAAAKLVLITGNSGADFAVIDGANFYDLTSSNIMSMSFPGENRIKAGVQSDTSTARKTVDMQLVTVTYDDTGAGGSLQFTLTGIGTVSQTDTAPSGGVYTETIKAKISPMSGEGTSDGKPFVATGMMNVSGKGTLPAIF